MVRDDKIKALEFSFHNILCLYNKIKRCGHDFVVEWIEFSAVQIITFQITIMKLNSKRKLVEPEKFNASFGSKLIDIFI